MSYFGSEAHKEALAAAKREREEALARGEELPAKPSRKARTPAAPVTDSPDFKAAVEAAVNEKLPALFAAIAQANGIARGESGDSFANALALQLAKFTGQGTGKTYVDPEELAKRDRGKTEMLRLLRECRVNGEVPAYKVIKQTQLDVPPFGPIVIEPLWRDPHSRVQHDTEIDYLWIPNLCMVPINDSAKRIFAQFEIWVAAEMPEVANTEDLLPGEFSPIARGLPLTGAQVLNPHTGTVIRGAAAAAVIRNDPALRDVGMQHATPMTPYQAASIRRGEDPAVRKKQVLGTLTDPIEMR